MGANSSEQVESHGDPRMDSILSARRQIEEMRLRGLELTSSASARAERATSAATILGENTIPGYVLRQELHRGGQGIVCLALQESTQRKVAIKVLHDRRSDDDTARFRFERETHLLGRLNHPNIVTIHDTGSVAGRLYFVMDYVSGQPLDAYVSNKRLGLRGTLELFVTVCDAVHEAHVRGIIHRDLKPGNILVDESGRPRILDFGLAKLASPDAAYVAPEVTETGQFVGSMPWASPEQAEARWHDVDIRSDVYSLGVILYQLLVGSFPYGVTGNLRQVVRNIVETDPTRPSTIRSHIDDEVETILLKCLSKEPARRYQSAGELARDLRNYLAGRAIEAKRDSSWYVFRKSVRRHRVPVAFVALVGMFFGAALVQLIVTNQREFGLRTEAQRQAAIAQAVNEFLNQDLLAAVQPGVQGRDVSMLEVLDAASERVAERFWNEPLVEASIRETLGRTYLELGEWNAALPHAERALAIRRSELGSAHPDTLSGMGLVARLYRRMARYDESQALFEELLDTARETLGDRHELTMKAINNLAVLHRDLGRFEEALRLNGEAMKIRLETLGEEHIDTLTSMNNQGYYLSYLARYREAEPLYTRVLEIRRRVLGTDHPHTLYSMSNLALLYYRVGRFEEAGRLQAERVEIGRRVHGDRHPKTIMASRNLGDIYREWRRYEQAEPLLVGALDTQRQVTGDEHPAIASCMMSLGQFRQLQRRFDEAEHLFSQALTIRRRASGPQNKFTIWIMMRMADLYLDWERFDDAEAALKGVPLYLGDQPTDWWFLTLHARGLLGKAYVGQGRYGEAEPLFREALALRREAVGDDHPDVGLCLGNLGWFLLHQHRLEEAEPILRQSLDVRRKFFGDGHMYLTSDLENLSLLLQEQGDYAEAETLLLEALQISKRAHGSDKTALARILRRVVDLYAGWGRPEKAEAYLALMTSIEPQHP